jgi:hypothetical protein
MGPRPTRRSLQLEATDVDDQRFGQHLGYFDCISPSGLN